MKTNEKIVQYVKEIKAGKESAFTGLYEESYKYLYTCIIHVVKDEELAQDLLQDTYVEIFKHIDQLKEDEGFLSWAATIANRKCFAYIKKKKAILVEDQTDDEGNSTDYFENIADDEAFIPENIFDNQEKVNIIRGIIDELSDVQRACVIGFYYNEQRQEEIADELGIPVNTVKSHLNRAKSKIKEAVGEVEKKQGIKLYSVAPFMAILFLKEIDVYAAELAVPAMGTSVSSAIAAKVASSAGAAKSAIFGGKVSSGAAKTAGAALKTKIAIGATVGALGIGAVAGINSTKKNPCENTYIDIVDIENQITIFEQPLSEMTRNEAEQYLMDFADSFEYRDDFSRDDVKECRYYDDYGLELHFTNLLDRPDSNYIDYTVYQYNEDGSGGAGQLVFSANRYLQENGQDQFDIIKPGLAILSWNVFLSGEEDLSLEESLSIRRYDSDDEEFSHRIKPLNCAFLGMKMEEYFNEIDSHLYEQVTKNGEVRFKNGTLTKDDFGYCFIFNDINPDETRYWNVRFQVDEEGAIDDVSFMGKKSGKLIDPEIYRVRSGIINNKEEQLDDNQNSNQIDTVENADELNLMSGEIDIDPLVGRSETMGWKKIKEVSDVITWGSTLYSSSGKALEVLCYDSSGKEIGMIETDRYMLGKGFSDGTCYYLGTEYEKSNFRVVVFDASDEMGPNSVWVHFYPVKE